MFDQPIDWIIIIAVVLILFGSTKKIPEFARNLGRASGEFTRGKMELQREIKDAMNAPPKDQSQVNYSETARTLGIDPNGKTDDQLRQEISEKINGNK